jgi:hypothetical protein
MYKCILFLFQLPTTTTTMNDWDVNPYTNLIPQQRKNKVCKIESKSYCRKQYYI